MPFDILVKQNATVDDTLRLIINAVNHCKSSPFVQKIVDELHLSDRVKSPWPQVQQDYKYEQIKKLFDWICRNAKYKLDNPGIEEVWTPEKVILEGTFDCKKISVLISSVLACAGIDSVLKHVYYSGADGSLEDFTHIYVIVPNPDLQNYITVDPTNECRYNKEVESNKQTLYFLNGKKMDLHMMGRAPQAPAPPAAPAPQPGVNTDCFTSQVHNTACQLENEMSGIMGGTLPGQTIGLLNKTGNFNYTVAGQILHDAKVLPFAPIRAAFLGLLYLGGLLKNTSLKINLPYNLANAWGHTSTDPNPDNNSASQFKKMWWEFGGEADGAPLKKAILAGVQGTGITSASMGGSPHNFPVGTYDRPYILTDAAWGHQGLNGTIGQGPETVAAIAAASPIIIAALTLIHKVTGKDAVPGPSTPAATVPGGVPVPPGGIPVPKAGSMLDLSSPVNTIVKAVFLMGISGMLTGPSFYIMNTFCIAAIIYAVSKKYFTA